MEIFLDPLVGSNENLQLIYGWRNNEKTRYFSFDSSLKSFNDFCKNYSDKYHSILSLPPFFIIFENQKVGVVYFESWLKDKGCQISIYLDPEFQNRQIGSSAIKKATSFAFEQQFNHLIAFIKEENVGAQKAFLKSGFSLENKVNVCRDDQKYPALKFILSKAEKRKTLVIAEAGSNFCVGDSQDQLHIGKKLIEAAYEAGADAVKFQMYQSQTVYVANAGSAGYLKQNINDVFAKCALSPDLFAKFADYANYLGIEIMCSFFSEEDFEKIDPYVQKHKIASYEIGHIQLLKKAALSQKPLFLSTGACNLEDIEWAVDTFKRYGGQDLTLLHCTAQYPAEVKALNLKSIPYLHQKFSLPVGLSDHSAHPIYAPVAAVTLGACAIEKHFTIHQKLPGPDHFFAIDCKELKMMIEAISESEKILGLAKKEVMPQEEELATFAKRGLQAICHILPGEVFQEGINVAILRPGMQRLGMHPKYIEKLNGKKAATAILPGCGIRHDDVLW